MGAGLAMRRNGVGLALGEGTYMSAPHRGNVTIMQSPRDELYTADYDELADAAEPLDDSGILVLHPRKVLEWKEAINREKDRHDIVSIKEWLARQAA
jgi:hypothetical protein